MNELHVLFQVDDGDFAVPAEQVLVMESFEGATRVPGAPPWVAGLVQIRGDVVPVVDLRLRFGLPRAEPSLDQRVVVVREGRRTVGMLVDRAREVLSIPADRFRDPPDAVSQSATRFVRSVASAGDRLLMLIDSARVLGEEDLYGEERTDEPGVGPAAGSASDRVPAADRVARGGDRADGDRAGGRYERA